MNAGIGLGSEWSAMGTVRRRPHDRSTSSVPLHKGYGNEGPAFMRVLVRSDLVGVVLADPGLDVFADFGR